MEKRVSVSKDVSHRCEFSPYAEEHFSQSFTQSYISRKYKICYVVICKSANSTIRKWFISLEGIENLVNEQCISQANRIIEQFPELSFEDAYKTIEL